MPLLFAALIGLLFIAAVPAQADNFRTISDRDTFVSVVRGKQLQIPLFGINLQVSEEGRIAGKAWGRDVTGNWQWSEDGYFCRDLYWGGESVGPNCQLVQLRGSTVRFTSDRGEGMHADLRLR